MKNLKPNGSPMTNAFRCAVSADLFRRAMAAISTEETRYYLNGVYVQPCAKGGALMTSTNGHWLVNIHDPRGIVEGAGIVKIGAAIKKALSPNRSDCLGPYGSSTERVLVVGNAGDQDHPGDVAAMVVLSGRVHTPKNSANEVEPRPDALGLVKRPNRHVIAAEYGALLIDGTYPDWTRVVPTEGSATAPTPPYNPAYVAKAGEILTDGKTGGVQLLCTDAASPMLVLPAQRRMHRDWDGFAVVMPLRADVAACVPAYFEPPKLPKAA